MKEELEGDKNSLMILEYVIYKTPNGLYLEDDICNEYDIGNHEEEKHIKEKTCFLIQEKDLDVINKKAKEKGIEIITNIKPYFDLQLHLSFTVIVDLDNNNTLYIAENICKRYDIPIKDKLNIEGIVYSRVSEEEINQIEEKTKKDKLILQKKYKMVSAISQKSKKAETAVCVIFC